MKTLIHIGQHKTGTTSIQHHLQRQRNALSAAGLYVPDALLGFANPSHFLLNVYALDEARDSTAKLLLKESVDAQFFSTLEERLKADIAHHYQAAGEKGCSHVLWSNEGLYLLNSAAEYNRLRQLFEPFSTGISCICCFRDKPSFVRSYTKQLEDQGLPLSSDPDSYRYLEADSWLLDYGRKQALLEAAFDDVLILSYDPQDMISVFMTGIGFPAEGDTRTLRLNPSS